MSGNAERALSFGSIAADYDRLRPGPPQKAVRWLLPSRCAVAVDLAAGTGLLSRALAGRAGEVVAVEPTVGWRQSSGSGHRGCTSPQAAARRSP